MYHQVVLGDSANDARAYQLLNDCIQQPVAASALRTLVAQYPLLYPWVSWEEDASAEEQSASLPTHFLQALEGLELGEKQTSWARALTCMTPGVVKAQEEEREAKRARNEIGRCGSTNVASDSARFQLITTLILITICPNINHFVTDINSLHGAMRFLKRNNYGRLSAQYLRHLKHVTVLRGSGLFEKENYAEDDPLGIMLVFHRLPEIESLSIRLVTDCHGGDTTGWAVPKTSALKSINITNSDISSSTLAIMIRIPRALETFRYSAGGDWANKGGHPRFYPKTIAKALWSQRDSLREIDIISDSRLFRHDEEEDDYEFPDGMYDIGQEPDPEQDPNVVLDREIELDGPRPLYPSAIDTAREYRGTIGSLHDFHALKRLSIGVKMLIGQGTRYQLPREHWEEDETGKWVRHVLEEGRTVIHEAPFRLIDALPKSLEFLRIRGYRKGQYEHWDDQIEELMTHKPTRLPNLKEVEGVETRLWTDDDFELAKKAYRIPPQRARSTFSTFMFAKKSLIKKEHPDWDYDQVHKEIMKLWDARTGKEDRDANHAYHVDLARYHKQMEDFEAGQPVDPISAERSEQLYKEHLRSGMLIKGRKGIEVLEKAIAAGEPDVVGQSFVDEAWVRIKKEEEEKKMEEAARTEELMGPKYEWLEVSDDALDDDWTKVQHDEL